MKMQSEDRIFILKNEERVREGNRRGGEGRVGKGILRLREMFSRRLEVHEFINMNYYCKYY